MLALYRSLRFDLESNFLHPNSQSVEVSVSVFEIPKIVVLQMQA